MSYRSSWMTEELEIFREQFRKFLAKDLAPHAEKWREQKMVDRFAWRGLGEMGALLPSVPEALAAWARPSPTMPRCWRTSKARCRR
jgi:acyl-CoA dehydrogenase